MSSAELRNAVLDLIALRRRTRFPVTVQVGRPRAVRSRLVVDTSGGRPLDDASRTDLATVLLEAEIRRADHARPILLWLTRPGPLEETATDAAWLRGTQQAAAELGVDVRFVVVTRHGWFEPATGDGRSWRRLRSRSSAARRARREAG